MALGMCFVRRSIHRPDRDGWTATNLREQCRPRGPGRARAILTNVCVSRGRYVNVVGISLTHAAAGAPLLRPRAGPSVSEQLSVRALLSTPSLRRPVILVTSMMCFQQLSGVNAVLFYSNGILMSIMPNAGAGMLSVGVTVVNALMTLPAIFLVDVS